MIRRSMSEVGDFKWRDPFFYTVTLTKLVALIPSPQSTPWDQDMSSLEQGKDSRSRGSSSPHFSLRQGFSCWD